MLPFVADCKHFYWLVTPLDSAKFLFAYKDFHARETAVTPCKRVRQKAGSTRMDAGSRNIRLNLQFA